MGSTSPRAGQVPLAVVSQVSVPVMALPSSVDIAEISSGSNGDAGNFVERKLRLFLDSLSAKVLKYLVPIANETVLDESDELLILLNQAMNVTITTSILQVKYSPLHTLFAFLCNHYVVIIYGHGKSIKKYFEREISQKWTNARLKGGYGGWKGVPRLHHVTGF